MPVTEEELAKLEKEVEESDQAYAELQKQKDLSTEDAISSDVTEGITPSDKTAKPSDQKLKEEVIEPELPVKEKKKKIPNKKTDDFEQQWKVGEGIRQKQADEIKQQRETIDELKDTIVDIEKQLRVNKDIEPSEPEPVLEPEVKVERPSVEEHGYLTADDREAYGDIITVIQKAAKEIVEKAIVAYDTKLHEWIGTQLTPMGKNIESVRMSQVEKDQAIFMTELKIHTPYAKQISELWENKDVHFLNWLNTPIPSTPFTKGEMLDRYNNVSDIPANAKGMAKLFDEYAKDVLSEQSLNPPKEEVSPPAAIQSVVAPAPTIEQLIEPDGVQSELEHVIETKKPMRQYSELTIASDKVSRGQMSVDDFEKLESEINIAEAEGRMVL